MGTRSLTRVFDGSVQVMNMYRQMDGYPKGHGLELYKFLKPFTVVNGLSMDDLHSDRKVANGAPCLAAQIVAHFKDGPGSIYLYPPESTDCGQNYEYHILVGDKNTIRIEVYDDYATVRVKPVFKGTVEAFGKFCNKDKED